jgi:hypothetical protein
MLNSLLFKEKSFIIRSSLRILLTPNSIIMAESNQPTNQPTNQKQNLYESA